MAVARRGSFPGMLFYHYNSDKGKIIRPDRAWSVRDLKEAVREKENLDKSESARLRVVYQGNELGDRQLLTVSDRHLSMRANRQKKRSTFPESLFFSPRIATFKRRARFTFSRADASARALKRREVGLFYSRVASEEVSPTFCL